MPRITEETLYQNLDFKCKRCGAECTKTDAFEAELGYVSKVNGQWEGPICSSCAGQIGEVAIKEVAEAAFLVVIKPHGQGVFITEEGIERLFMRSATPYDIIAACNQVEKDVDEALFASKLASQITGIMHSAKQQSVPLAIPRKLVQK